LLLLLLLLLFIIFVFKTSHKKWHMTLDEVNEQTTKNNWLFIQSLEMLCKIVIELVAVWAVALFSWKNLYSFSSSLRLKTKSVGVCLLYPSKNKMMGPVILVALRAHHTPTLMSCNAIWFGDFLLTVSICYFYYLHDGWSNLNCKICQQSIDFTTAHFCKTSQKTEHSQQRLSGHVLWMELEHQGPAYQFAATLFFVISNIVFHSKNPLYYTISYSQVGMIEICYAQFLNLYCS